MNALDDDGVTIRCLECSRRYRALATHLTRAHGMSTEDYRQAHGIARTIALISAASAEVRAELGRTRRDTDPRVLQALDSQGARDQRAGPYPARTKRTSTLEATRTAARTRAARRWNQALAGTGWDTWQDAIAWATAQGVGWAAIARRMGTAQTATRRAGEAAGARLAPALSPATASMLAAAREHAAAHGDLSGTTGHMARWLATRRHLARTSPSTSPVDAALDQIDPAWRSSRRSRA